MKMPLRSPERNIVVVLLLGKEENAILSSGTVIGHVLTLVNFNV